MHLVRSRASGRPQGVEIGYTVFPAFRWRGYASEASRALIDWAHDQHQVSQFILSISPENTPPLRLARRLGFVEVGSEVDEEDGEELVFRWDDDAGETDQSPHRAISRHHTGAGRR
jgi:RimJ/RimL family protein N-acetyltransferase